VGSKTLPDEPEDDLDNDEDLEDEEAFGDEGLLFSCPFCGSEDDGCPHFLGSRDLNFCGDFSVDDAGELAELSELFGELGEAVAAFAAGGKKKARIAALTPRRLKELVQAVADGDDNRGFTEYVEQVGRDTKVAVQSNSYEENSGPCFCSVVHMYWTRDVPAVVAGMRQRVAQDIRRLKKHAVPGTFSGDDAPVK
jgi:hypothetical protein